MSEKAGEIMWAVKSTNGKLAGIIGYRTRQQADESLNNEVYDLDHGGVPVSLRSMGWKVVRVRITEIEEE